MAKQEGMFPAELHSPGNAGKPGQVNGQLRGGFGGKPRPKKKKRLLHLLVKEVLIHSRKTVEIGYVLPDSQRFANRDIWLPDLATLRMLVVRPIRAIRE